MNFLILFCLPLVIAVEQINISHESPNADIVCNTTATEVVWTHMGKDLPDTKPIIKITSKEEAGTYLCSTIEGNFTFQVNYIGKTYFENIQRSLTLNNGDTDRKLKCINSDSSNTLTFIWSYRSEHEIHDEQKLLKDENIDIKTNFTKSVLSFKKLTYEKRGYYICTAKSIAGNSSVEVLIRVKDKFAALWPFLGIVLEVLILVGIIFFFERKTKKSSDENLVLQVNDEAIPLKEENAKSGLRTRINNNK